MMAPNNIYRIYYTHQIIHTCLISSNSLCTIKLSLLAFTLARQPKLIALSLQKPKRKYSDEDFNYALLIIYVQYFPQQYGLIVFPYCYYQLMQIKKPVKQHLINPSQNSYNHYNLCFNYSNSKKLQALQKKSVHDLTRNISTSIAKTSTQPVQTNRFNRTSCQLSTRYQNRTFYTSPKNKQMYLPLEKYNQQDEIQYIPHPFPQGKKKSGEHQLFKLLLKYSNNFNSPINNDIKHPLFNDNPDIRKGLKPKVKNFTRLNWIKDRYCVNRDKQHGIIQQAEGFGFNNKLNHQNATLLRANLNPKKIF